MRLYYFALVALLGVLPTPLIAQQAPSVPTELTDYIKRPEPDYCWKLVDKKQSATATVYNIKLVSQKWQDIVWEHDLQIVMPKDTKPQSTMVLWNQGGRPSAGSAMIATQLSEKIKAPVAFLFGIPKQPLFGGKTEDALIAETFVKYLETKDPSWPLLFPMVKSLIKTMDTVQAFAKEEWKFEVKSFVVTGASKRGWTSWLTAATGDPRVKAIAPMVIDTLNFPVQMRNQVAAFGKPSEMIKDYTLANLVPIPDTTDGTKLWQMVDPYVYREKLTLPKMIINGTNDPYWPQDALNTYWDELKGEKHVLYVPNAGHGLRERTNGKEQLFPERAVTTLAAFCRSQITDKKLPMFEGRNVTTKDGQEYALRFDTPTKNLRLWVADSTTRDFRQATWTAKDLSKIPVMESLPMQARVPIEAPTTGLRAVLVEGEFDIDGLTFNLSTPITILEAKK